MEQSYTTNSFINPRWKTNNPKGYDADFLHKAALYKDYMVVYGTSFDVGNKGPFHSYHLPSKKWQLADADQEIESQWLQVDCAFCLFDSDKIVIYGGYQNAGPTRRVTIVQIIEGEDRLAIKSQKVESQEAPVRTGHTGDIYENQLLVFGGQGLKSKTVRTSVSNELWSMDLSTFKWTKLETTGTVPTARYDHSSLIHDKKLYIYGGLSSKDECFKQNSFGILCLESMKWERVIPKGIQCPPRAKAILTSIGNTICLFGGRVTAYSSMYAAPMFLYDPEKNVLESVFQRENREIERMDPARGIVYKNSLIVAHARRGAKNASPPFYFISFEKPQDVVGTPCEFGDLLFSEKDSDISFLIEDTKIPAHKDVLSTQCTYFEKMFASGMKESQSSCLKIDDVKLDTFKNFLTFLYTGQIQLNHSIALELYRLADKYQQKELLRECEEYLLDNLCLATFHETAVLSGECGSDQLRADITRYIRLHKLEMKANPELLKIPEAYKSLLEE